LSIDLCSQRTNTKLDGSHISPFLRLSGFISGGLETSPQEDPESISRSGVGVAICSTEVLL